ncbi:rab-like protein 2B isoform X2 [Physeter macrocephalus]|uniref:Rab-like protein 2B isoform X2 n=1 Tax=Physeter macrocephalus TaxID=9755 RepID=A0A455BFE5_PHYMC|nr:rab-like protein 2B isoform X2 [Physeter catodon]|eukprot:XP_028346643.1 rab-like protein 2B isoform X2 [Physeter catodon]
MDCILQVRKRSLSLWPFPASCPLSPTAHPFAPAVRGAGINFWDTAGQERFQSMHASYYHKAHACIMVFDVQRKITYKHLSTWYTELREFRPEIPCIVVANKIDGEATLHLGASNSWGGPPSHVSSSSPGPANHQRSILFRNIQPLAAGHHCPPSKDPTDIKMTQKSFSFARKFSLPLYFVSAADGTNVVKLFSDAIRLAVSYKQNSRDFMDEVLQELENISLEQEEEDMLHKERRGRAESPSPS